MVLQERRGSLEMNWNDLFQNSNADQQFKAWKINSGKRMPMQFGYSLVPAAAIFLDGLLHSSFTDSLHWHWSVA